MAHDLLPIAPAAHYCMGGVMVDTLGRTTVPGLYAVGEVACNGVHGANGWLAILYWKAWSMACVWQTICLFIEQRRCSR